MRCWTLRSTARTRPSPRSASESISSLASKPSSPGPGAYLDTAGEHSRLMERDGGARNPGAHVFLPISRPATATRTGEEAARRRVTCPAVFVMGSKDMMTSPKAAQALAAGCLAPPWSRCRAATRFDGREAGRKEVLDTLAGFARKVVASTLNRAGTACNTDAGDNHGANPTAARIRELCRVSIRYYLNEHRDRTCRRPPFRGVDGSAGLSGGAGGHRQRVVAAGCRGVGLCVCLGGPRRVREELARHLRRAFCSLMGDWVMYADILRGRIPF